MNKKILLVGGGGHCKSVLDSLLETNRFSEIAIIDKKENIGKNVFGVSIIGCDDDLFQLSFEGFQHAFVTMGSVGNTDRRVELFNRLEEIGFEVPNIIDPSATLSRHAKMGKGIFLGKRAVVNAGAIVGSNAIINTGSIVEHDCVIGPFVHLAPGAVLSGNVQIGEYTHIGANSVIKQGVTVGPHSVIGMGSVVTKDCGDYVIAYGNPCKEVRVR